MVMRKAGMHTFIYVCRYPFSVCTQMYLFIFMGYFEPRDGTTRREFLYFAINKSKLFALFNWEYDTLCDAAGEMRLLRC